MGSRIISEPVEEALRLIEEAERQNIILRALGGVAVKLHTEREPEIFKRDYSDIDLVVDKDTGLKLQISLNRWGTSPMSLLIHTTVIKDSCTTTLRISGSWISLLEISECATTSLLITACW